MISLPEVHDFLTCKTPKAWLDTALSRLDILLVDHANCEKKAAGNALQLIHNYPGHYTLLQKMSRLAREELMHFQKVIQLLKRREIPYVPLKPSRYARILRQEVRTYEPARLVDFLLIGAIIEARSCERFHALVPYLDEELADFYARLYEAEKRHFHDYLLLAQEATKEPVLERLDYLKSIEAELILSEDSDFHFHSGVMPAC